MKKRTMYNGYPTKYALKLIENWDKDIYELINFIENLWTFKKFGFKLKKGKDFLGRKVNKLELHTGGWSGNEDIIHALEKNSFYYLHWSKVERGGHYYFELPLKN